MNRWRAALQELKKYPTAVAGLLLIAFLLGLSAYAVIAIPYRQALELWRGGEHWQAHPRNAAPAWTNLFRRRKLPPTVRLDSVDNGLAEQDELAGLRRQRITLPFTFNYFDFPSEINLFLETEFTRKTPLLSIRWQTPDGRQIDLGAYRPLRRQRLSLSQDRELAARLGHPGHIGLMTGSAESEHPTVLRGDYQVVLEILHFEPGSQLRADFIVYGRVHGLAGTDHQRRDLLVALLWGTPIALLFGLAAALGTTLTTLVIATAGVWYGGRIDAAIQRITEVNMILPLLPVLVMVGTLYSRSLWLMLAVVVAFGLFSAGVKMYRAMLLPVRRAPFVEAAQAYGAGSRRIIFRYMIPRVLPVLVPAFVTLIPTFVFLEASLAVLGLGDPLLPTWGKILNDAQQQSALYNQHYYWVLTPAAMLMLTGLGFALLGFAMDRIFNPRLRSD